MSDLHDQAKDATPLSPDERDGLIPSHITLRGELNELEQQNIQEAMIWLTRRQHDPLAESFAKALHKRMFSDVWRWAGTYRRSDKNIGDVSHWEIQPKLHEVFANVSYWIEHGAYEPDEIAARFHRDIVWIHPFPNGNGRWARMMADVLLAKLGQPVFSWGGSTLRDPSEMRRAYIVALQSADKHELERLLLFARS